MLERMKKRNKEFGADGRNLWRTLVYALRPRTAEAAITPPDGKTWQVTLCGNHRHLGEELRFSRRPVLTADNSRKIMANVQHG